jgi:hypothetical protein
MKALAEQIADIDAVEIYGRVAAVRGLMVEEAGPIHAISVGASVNIETGQGVGIPGEMVGLVRWLCHLPRSTACSAATAPWCQPPSAACAPRRHG